MNHRDSMLCMLWVLMVVNGKRSMYEINLLARTNYNICKKYLNFLALNGLIQRNKNNYWDRTENGNLLVNLLPAVKHEVLIKCQI